MRYLLLVLILFTTAVLSNADQRTQELPSPVSEHHQQWQPDPWLKDRIATCSSFTVGCESHTDCFKFGCWGMVCRECPSCGGHITKVCSVPRAACPPLRCPTHTTCPKECTSAHDCAGCGHNAGCRKCPNVCPGDDNKGKCVDKNELLPCSQTCDVCLKKETLCKTDDDCKQCGMGGFVCKHCPVCEGDKRPPGRCYPENIGIECPKVQCGCPKQPDGKPIVCSSDEDCIKAGCGGDIRCGGCPGCPGTPFKGTCISKSIQFRCAQPSCGCPDTPDGEAPACSTSDDCKKAGCGEDISCIGCPGCPGVPFKGKCLSNNIQIACRAPTCVDCASEKIGCEDDSECGCDGSGNFVCRKCPNVCPGDNNTGQCMPKSNPMTCPKTCEICLKTKKSCVQDGDCAGCGHGFACRGCQCPGQSFKGACLPSNVGLDCAAFCGTLCQKGGRCNADSDCCSSESCLKCPRCMDAEGAKVYAEGKCIDSHSKEGWLKFKACNAQALVSCSSKE